MKDVFLDQISVLHSDIHIVMVIDETGFDRSAALKASKIFTF
jgi:hypothetical protein